MIEHVTASELRSLKVWYREYVDSFFISDDKELLENYELKDIHTQNVCVEIIQHAQKLNFSQNEINTAETIALFHDIGRFEQFKKYSTFSDSRSANHALLGIDILKSNSVLDILPYDTQKLILTAIENHNKAFIDKDVTGKTLQFCRMIRDADKLDIYRVVTEYYRQRAEEGRVSKGIELNLPDTEVVSDAVCNALINREIVKINDICNLNDFKLLQAGWIFDVNFAFTLKKIKKIGYLENIKRHLPDSNLIDKLFVVINKYIDEKLEINH